MSKGEKTKNSSQEIGIERLASQRVKGVLPRKYHMEYRSGQEELVEDKSLKEVEEMILAAGEELELPESLLPENMGRRLVFVREQRLRRRRILIAVLIVAAIVVAFILVNALR